jgi:hypothetical protein
MRLKRGVCPKSLDLILNELQLGVGEEIEDA